MQLLDLARRGERLDRRVGQRLDLVLDALREEILEVVGVEIVGADPEEEAVEDGRRASRRSGPRSRRRSTQSSGHFMTTPPDVYRRSLRSVSSAFRIAQFDLKISSRKTISAVGEHALDAALVAALAERRDVDRTEDLVRLGEAREEVLEVVRLEEAREHADERALRRAGRADEHGVLAGDDGDEQEADDLVLAEEARLERTRHLRETHREGCSGRRVLGLNHAARYVTGFPAARPPRRARAWGPSTPSRGRARA